MLLSLHPFKCPTTQKPSGMACTLILMFKIENSMVVEIKKWGKVVKDNQSRNNLRGWTNDKHMWVVVGEVNCKAPMIA
jgi:hypothetical protein